MCFNLKHRKIRLESIDKSGNHAIIITERMNRHQSKNGGGFFLNRKWRLKMTADGLALYAGVVLSLLFSYIPGLNTWFAALESVYKRLIMLGLLLLSAAAIYGLSCAGWAADLNIAITCDKAGILALLQAFVLAMIANQAAYQISPATPKVRAAKAK